MTNREGVDVSSWNGAPGQWKTHAGDIGWAAVKLTELKADGSRYINPDALADWEYLAAAGKKRVAYLFAHPSTSPAETAAFFTGEIRRLGLRDDDMIAVDLEVNDGMPAVAVAAWTRSVLALLEHDLDRTPLLYTFIDFAQEGNCEGCGSYPLWIAAPSYPPGKPELPGPWASFAIHQFSLSQPIDRDITAWPSAAHMAAALGKQGTMHAAPPKPKPKKKVIKKTVTKTKKTVQKEPAITTGTLAAALSALLAYLQANKAVHLTPAELQSAAGILVALAGIITTALTKPKAVGALTTTLATGATVIASTIPSITHLTPAATLAQVPLGALAVSLLARSHLTPTASDPAGGASSTERQSP